MTPAERAARMAEIEAREKEAIPGPWLNGTDGGWQHGGTIRCAGVGRLVVAAHEQHPIEPKNNAFICHARADVPYLLAEVQRLEGENTRLRSDNRELRDWVTAVRERSRVVVIIDDPPEPDPGGEVGT